MCLTELVMVIEDMATVSLCRPDQSFRVLSINLWASLSLAPLAVLTSRAEQQIN